VIKDNYYCELRARISPKGATFRIAVNSTEFDPESAYKRVFYLDEDNYFVAVGRCLATRKRLTGQFVWGIYFDRILRKSECMAFLDRHGNEVLNIFTEEESTLAVELRSHFPHHYRTGDEW